MLEPRPVRESLFFEANRIHSMLFFFKLLKWWKFFSWWMTARHRLHSLLSRVDAAHCTCVYLCIMGRRTVKRRRFISRFQINNWWQWQGSAWNRLGTANWGSPWRERERSWLFYQAFLTGSFYLPIHWMSLIFISLFIWFLLGDPHLWLVTRPGVANWLATSGLLKKKNILV